MNRLAFRNRQKTRRLDLRLLRRITRSLLLHDLNIADFELCFHLVSATEMAGINSRFLGHDGSTDVITFDYTPNGGAWNGEVFLSVDDAVSQARQFRATWQSELIRYIVHAVLHLSGEDDRKPSDRRRMKRRENRLLRNLARRFPLSKLGQGPRLRR